MTVQVSVASNIIEVIKNVNNIIGQLNDGLFNAIGVNIVTYSKATVKNIFDLPSLLTLIGTIAFGIYFVKNNLRSAVGYLFRKF